jgi:hypothetical protein
MRGAFEAEGLAFAVRPSLPRASLSVLIGNCNFLGIHSRVVFTKPKDHPQLTAVDVRLPTTRAAIVLIALKRSLTQPRWQSFSWGRCFPWLRILSRRHCIRSLLPNSSQDEATDSHISSRHLSDFRCRGNDMSGPRELSSARSPISSVPSCPSLPASSMRARVGRPLPRSGRQRTTCNQHRPFFHCPGGQR